MRILGDLDLMATSWCACKRREGQNEDPVYSLCLNASLALSVRRVSVIPSLVPDADLRVLLYLSSFSCHLPDNIRQPCRSRQR